MGALLGLRYRRAVGDAEKGESEASLSAESFELLPVELLQRLQESLLLLDSEAIDRVTQKIEAVDATLTTSMRSLTREFKYAPLSAMCARALEARQRES
jgi:hypothetical protein